MKKIIFIAVFYFLSISAFGQSNPAIIPYPANIDVKSGQFTLSNKTQLHVADQGKFANEVFYLQNLLKPVIGQYLSPEKGDNVIEINYSAKNNHCS